MSLLVPAKTLYLFTCLEIYGGGIKRQKDHMLGLEEFGS